MECPSIFNPITLFTLLLVLHITCLFHGGKFPELHIYCRCQLTRSARTDIPLARINRLKQIITLHKINAPNFHPTWNFRWNKRKMDNLLHAPNRRGMRILASIIHKRHIIWGEFLIMQLGEFFMRHFTKL